MEVKIDINKIITAVILALIMYIANTVHTLDKEVSLINYKMEQNNYLFQDLSERIDKANKKGN